MYSSFELLAMGDEKELRDPARMRRLFWHNLQAQAAAFPLLLGLALQAGAAVKNPDTYIYLSAADANSLDPAWSGDGASQQIILNIYETLFAFEGGSTDKVMPLLASAVPSLENGLLSADGRTYTIPIREGVRFHDGTPLTAKDVRYSLLRFMIMDAGPAMMLLDPLAGYRGTRDNSGQLRPTLFSDIDKAIRIEQGKLVQHLPRPFPPLLPILERRVRPADRRGAR